MGGAIARLQWAVTLGACSFAAYLLCSAGCPAKVPSYELRLNNRLSQIAVGLALYSQDNDYVLPPVKDNAGYAALLAPYTKTSDLCLPDSNKRYVVNPSVCGRRIKSIALPAFTVVLFEPEPARDDTIGFVTVEGSSGRAGKELWAAIDKVSRIP